MTNPKYILKSFQNSFDLYAVTIFVDFMTFRFVFGNLLEKISFLLLKISKNRPKFQTKKGIGRLGRFYSMWTYWVFL